MKRALLVGLVALVPALAPGLAWTQPQQAPIVATPLPLLPPSVQYPPAAPAPGQPQPSQVQPPQGLPSQDQQPQYQPQAGQQPDAPPQGQFPQGQPPPGQPPPGQPPPGQPPPGQPPQGLQPPTAAPAQGQPSAPDQAQQPSAPEQPAPPPPNPWLPQGGAILQVLDKVNAQAVTLSVKAGQTATYGSLSIAVQACVVRPPDLPRDAAAFLTITDSHPDQPGFKGWMLKSDPSLSMLEHPLYDVRVIGCAP